MFHILQIRPLHYHVKHESTVSDTYQRLYVVHNKYLTHIQNNAIIGILQIIMSNMNLQEWILTSVYM